MTSQAWFARPLIILSCCIYVVAVPIGLSEGTYDVLGGLLLAPLLVLIGMQVLRRLTRYDEPWIRQTIVAALFTKMLGAGIRYVVTFQFLGPADANSYHNAGSQLAEFFRVADFGNPVVKNFLPDLIGTSFIRFITGILYTLTGPTKLGGFMVFSWLSFWGLYLFFRAFRLAIPDGDHRRYAVFIFFFPSLVFWPSSIGKEAWMLFTLGIAAYGMARVLTSRPGGFLALVLGMTGTAMIRPHVTLIVFSSVAVAYLLRSSSTASRSPLAGFGRIVGIIVLVIGGIIVVSTAARSFLGVREGSTSQAFSQALVNVEGRTAQGGSEFIGARPSSPIDYPWAVVTVMSRPFPYEASNVAAAIASIEGLALIGLVVVSHAFSRTFRWFRRRPYVAFALTFVVIFTYAFSAINNFGILARQRSQLLPFVLVLCALPPFVRAAPRPLSTASARFQGRRRRDHAPVSRA